MWFISFTKALSLVVAASCANVRAEVVGAEVFREGAALVGGANGMFFDPDNNLYVAQALGRTISKIDTETGSVLEQMSLAEGVFFPDDVTVDENGTLYWTDLFAGIVGQRPVGGEPESLYPFGTYPGANPITLSDDGKRLFFAQCFDFEMPTGIYQRDLVTNETAAILEDVPLCASNAMDFRNESLYSPQPFASRVIRIDLENNNEVVLTTNVSVPIAVKFDLEGRLHVLDASNGQVLRVDLDNPDTSANTELVAQLPVNGLDNLAFDKDNRLFVSSFSTGTIWEVRDTTDFRTVSPGSFSVTSGVAVVNDVLYTVHPLAIHGYDISTADEVTFVDFVPGFGELLFPWGVIAMEESLIILSPLTNSLMIWNVTSESAIVTAQFEVPTDAHPFQGGILVVEVDTGTIVNATGADLSSRSVVAIIPGVLFLAGNETDVYATNAVNGTVLKIISDNVVLDPPKVVSSGHDFPEGLALVGNELLVVSTGSGKLEKVDIMTGDIRTVVEDLEFLPGLPDFGQPEGFSNDVTVHDGYAYVNADGSNVIYKVELDSSTSSGGFVLFGGVLVNLIVMEFALLLST